jgi:hypothetical protein
MKIGPHLIVVMPQIHVSLYLYFQHALNFGINHFLDQSGILMNAPNAQQHLFFGKIQKKGIFWLRN